MKLIKINTDHYVVVDETIQPVNDYYYDSLINKIKNTNGADYEEASHCWQITHSTKRLEDYFSSAIYTNYLPISLQEVKELTGEADVEKKADKMFPNPYFVMEGLDITPAYKEGYVVGYNQALEDNKKKKYTEENMRKAIEFGYDLRNSHKPINSGIDWVKILTQSLQPKTEWEVEIVDGKLKLK